MFSVIGLIYFTVIIFFPFFNHFTAMHVIASKPTPTLRMHERNIRNCDGAARRRYYQAPESVGSEIWRGAAFPGVHAAAAQLSCDPRVWLRAQFFSGVIPSLFSPKS